MLIIFTANLQKYFLTEMEVVPVSLEIRRVNSYKYYADVINNSCLT